MQYCRFLERRGAEVSLPKRAHLARLLGTPSRGKSFLTKPNITRVGVSFQLYIPVPIWCSLSTSMMQSKSVRQLVPKAGLTHLYPVGWQWIRGFLQPGPLQEVLEDWGVPWEEAANEAELRGRRFRRSRLRRLVENEGKTEAEAEEMMQAHAMRARLLAIVDLVLLAIAEEQVKYLFLTPIC